LFPPPSMGGPAELFPPHYGFSLAVVYLVWLTVVAIAYPVCRWYANFKQRRRDSWWLSYL
jgi:ABC-type spermidine/putrescine transport system permease subunit I